MDFLVMSRNQKIRQYPSHSHEMWEVLLNMEGTGIAQINGQDYPFREGTIFCIRPGIFHSKRSVEGFVDGSVMIRDFCFKDEKADVLVFQDDERRTFFSLFQISFQYPLNPATDIYAERFLRSVVDAMQNLLRHWRAVPSQSKEVRRAMKQMADHVSDAHFDISRVVEASGYSPNHFRKLFREQCGYSPLQYYLRLKVQLAKQQILQNESIMSMQEIARLCGFEDPFYFSRLFRKIEGVSPMQFLKESKTVQLKAEEIETREQRQENLKEVADLRNNIQKEL